MTYKPLATHHKTVNPHGWIDLLIVCAIIGAMSAISMFLI